MQRTTATTPNETNWTAQNHVNWSERQDWCDYTHYIARPHSDHTDHTDHTDYTDHTDHTDPKDCASWATYSALTLYWTCSIFVMVIMYILPDRYVYYQLIQSNTIN